MKKIIIYICLFLLLSGCDVRPNLSEVQSSNQTTLNTTYNETTVQTTPPATTPADTVSETTAPAESTVQSSLTTTVTTTVQTTVQTVPNHFNIDPEKVSSIRLDFFPQRDSVVCSNEDKQSILNIINTLTEEIPNTGATLDDHRGADIIVYMKDGTYRTISFDTYTLSDEISRFGYNASELLNLQKTLTSIHNKTKIAPQWLSLINPEKLVSIYFYDNNGNISAIVDSKEMATFTNTVLKSLEAEKGTGTTMPEADLSSAQYVMKVNFNSNITYTIGVYGDNSIYVASSDMIFMTQHKLKDNEALKKFKVMFAHHLSNGLKPDELAESTAPSTTTVPPVTTTKGSFAVRP